MGLTAIAMTGLDRASVFLSFFKHTFTTHTYTHSHARTNARTHVERVFIYLHDVCCKDNSFLLLLYFYIFIFLFFVVENQAVFVFSWTAFPTSSYPNVQGTRISNPHPHSHAHCIAIACAF